MESLSVIETIIYAAYLLTVIGTALVIISENRNPTKTLAWILVLVFLPAIGLVFYALFGRDNRNTRAVQVDIREFSREIAADLAAHGRDTHPTDYKPLVDPRYRNLVNLLEQNDDSALWRGSDIEVITRGERKFEALTDDLEHARHHIHMEYFNFKDDEVGKRVKEILMRKAREGVEVRFIYENVANIGTRPRYYYEMREAGVEVVPFSTARMPWVRRSVNYRNHRKVAVIDGHIGYVGGMNIGHEYVYEWRDTHLRIVGQGVYGLQHSFLYSWYASAGKHVESYADYFPTCEENTDSLLLIDPEAPTSPYPNLLFAVNEIVYAARDYLYIQTPYYLPSESLLQALQAAALKGVDVRIMVPQRADFRFMDFANQSYYAESLKAGIRIYEYQNTFIHAKTIVSDDYLSLIGSANMDFRSLELSYEINSYLYGRDMAEHNKAIFLEDMKNCRELQLESWQKRPWYRKLLESVLRVFAPLL